MAQDVSVVAVIPVNEIIAGLSLTILMDYWVRVDHVEKPNILWYCQFTCHITCDLPRRGTARICPANIRCLAPTSLGAGKPRKVLGSSMIRHAVCPAIFCTRLQWILVSIVNVSKIVFYIFFKWATPSEVFASRTFAVSITDSTPSDWGATRTIAVWVTLSRSATPILEWVLLTTLAIRAPHVRSWDMIIIKPLAC